MSFRRRRPDPQRKRTDAWLAEIWPTLRELGLPPEVVRDAEHWEDFLDNGTLHRMRPTSGWSFVALTREQMRRLREVLEERYGTEADIALLNWLRARSGESAAGFDRRS